MSVWAEDKHEEALGTCDTNRCEKNNCEHSQVGYIDSANISLTCFRDCTKARSFCWIYTQFQGLGFSLGLHLPWMLWNCKSNPNSCCVGSMLWFRSFTHQPHTVTEHCAKGLPNTPANVGSRCSASPGTLEVYVYLVFCGMYHPRTQNRQ